MFSISCSSGGGTSNNELYTVMMIIIKKKKRKKYSPTGNYIFSPLFGARLDFHLPQDWKGTDRGGGAFATNLGEVSAWNQSPLWHHNTAFPISALSTANSMLLLLLEKSQCCSYLDFSPVQDHSFLTVLPEDVIEAFFLMFVNVCGWYWWAVVLRGLLAALSLIIGLTQTAPCYGGSTPHPNVFNLPDFNHWAAHPSTYIYFLFFPSEAWVGTPGVQPMECNKLAPPHCVWHTNPEAKHPADIMSFNLSVFYKHCKYLQPFNELTRSHRYDTVWGYRYLPGSQPGASFVFSQFPKFSGIDRGHAKTAPAGRTMKIYIWKWEN